MKTPGPKTPDSPSPRTPKPIVRVLLSALIALHLFAVFVGPWALPPQASELAANSARLLQPYLQILSLDNGYRFFAPEPGPSHLVRYEVTLADGKIVEGEFPNVSNQWPRLLYHRYFMLSEFVNSLDNRGMPPELLKAYAKSYAEHLAQVHGTRAVKLYLRRHYVPRVSEVREGRQLSDKVLYEERLLYQLDGEQS